MLPEEKLGVVAVASLDVTNSVAARVANGALRAMLAVRAGESPQPPPTTDPLSPGVASTLEGRYGEGRQGVELVARGDRLFLYPIGGPVRLELRARGDTLVADDRLAYGIRILHRTDGIEINGQALARAPDATPPEAPSRWAELIGEYGWDHSVLYIFERHGRLHSIIEWLFEYPLDEVGPDRFAFAGEGMYPGEELVFQRGSDGRIQGVSAASVYFPRRDVGTAAGVTFRIDPVRPVAELRAEALAASPPTESGDFRDPDLVEVTELDPSIRLDIRYATDNNFMGDIFYESPRAFLQRPAAEALVRVHQGLAESGYGLLIYDGYRPWYVTKMFFDATPAEHKIFVADPAAGSRHNRGCAVDLTLYDLATGQPVAMVGGYDEFSPRSYPDYPGGTTLQRWYRELLRDAMEAEGFTIYEAEWWHFDYRDWREYPILNQTFEELTQQGATP
jgi:D-alanyl-D-alanine dipeptidase